MVGNGVNAVPDGQYSRAVIQGDTVAPYVSARVPEENALVGASHKFSIRVSDESGIQSVIFVVQASDTTITQAFTPILWGMTLGPLLSKGLPMDLGSGGPRYVMMPVRWAIPMSGQRLYVFG